MQQQIRDWLPGQGEHGEVAPSETRVKRQVPFPVETYAALPKTGTAAVTGRLVYTTDSGERIIGGGETVSIAPATEYSAEAADVALSGRHIEPADPRAREYTHTVKTDDRGYFDAHGIPAGTFYVASSVELPSGDRSPLILKQVDVRNGATVKVDLSC